MEEFMESEHSGIFRVELVTKNVVLGSWGTHFMHMRVNFTLLKNVSHVPMCYRETSFSYQGCTTSIDKRNLFLLNGRAVPRCRHKSLQEKFASPTDRKSNFQILIISKNKLSKGKLHKSKFVNKITECHYLFTF